MSVAALLHSQSLAVPKGKYPYKWTLELANGQVFRIYNVIAKRARWREVDAERATHRIFVSADKKRYRYELKSAKAREMVGREDMLVRQLEDAMRAGGAELPPILNQDRAEIAREGDRCYFTDAEGKRWRVYDGWFKHGEHVTVAPDSDPHASSRYFIGEGGRPKRVYNFTSPTEMAVSIPNFTRQLEKALWLGHRTDAAVDASAWKDELTPR